MTYTNMMKAITARFPNYSRILFSYGDDNKGKKAYVEQEISDVKPDETMSFGTTKAYIYLFKPNAMQQNPIDQLNEALKATYLDYVNNYVTVRKIAEHYQIREDQMEIILYLGGELNNNR